MCLLWNGSVHVPAEQAIMWVKLLAFALLHKTDSLDGAAGL